MFANDVEIDCFFVFNIDSDSYTDYIIDNQHDTWHNNWLHSWLQYWFLLVTYFTNWSINWYHFALIDCVVDYELDFAMLSRIRILWSYNQQYNQH